MNARRFRDDSGAYAVVFAIAMVAVVGIAAFVIDLGMMQVARRQSQTAADLSALAAAQELPDKPNSAVDYAATYLADNGRPVAGWPDTAAAAATLTNGDYADGEVRCYLPTDSLDEDGEACADTTNPTAVRVWAPQRSISFAFFPILNALLGQSGSTSGNVGAAATVQIRAGGLGILPFVVPGNAAIGPSYCLKDNATGSAPPGCSGPYDTGNFLFADIIRAGVTGANETLTDNIKFGADHNPVVFPETPTPLDEECKSDGNPTGAVLDSGQNGFNCLTTQTGNKNDVLGNGLISFTSKNSCDGRIATKDPSLDAIPIYAGCWLTPVKTWPIDPSTGKYDTGILSDPRFAFVPVVYSTNLTGKSSYPIKTFYGAYITQVWFKVGSDNVESKSCASADPTCSSNDQVTAIQVTLLDPTLIPAKVEPNVGSTTDYEGVGPKVPVLVR